MNSSVELDLYKKRFIKAADKFYNKSVKETYVIKLNKDAKRSEYTPHPITRLFTLSADLEKEVNKDIFEFSIKEFESFFSMAMPSSETASTNNVSLISKYIDWAIENGYLIGLNQLRKMNPEWKTKFGKTKLKNLWTDVEIRRILESRVNYQDAVIVALLFLGIQGKKNEELINIKKSDINYDSNLLTLTSEGITRELIIPDWAVKYIAGAVDERIYKKKNGNPAPDIKSAESKLNENNYVIRSVSNTKSSEVDRAREEIINRRLTPISKELDENLFNPSSIIKSGALAMAKDFYLESELLKEADLEEVFKYYNISSHGIKRRWKNEFLNVETIKELYNL